MTPAASRICMVAVNEMDEWIVRARANTLRVVGVYMVDTQKTTPSDRTADYRRVYPPLDLLAQVAVLLRSNGVTLCRTSTTTPSGCARHPSTGGECTNTISVQTLSNHPVR